MAQSSLLNVFQEHRSELLAYMAARLRCPFTAHDLVQDLFLKIFALERSGEVANGKAYVFRMAANLVIDHQRRTSRHGVLLAQAESYLHGADDVPTPERQAMVQEELRDLAAAVERLSPTTRRIFKRNRFEGGRSAKSPRSWASRKRPWRSTSARPWPHWPPIATGHEGRYRHVLPATG